MQDNEPKLSMMQRILISLGVMYPPEDELDNEEDGIILPGKTPKVLHFPRDTQTQIAVVTPTSLNATQVPADFLKSGRAVLVNFHGLDKKVADNARFFLSGITYAIDGSLQKVTDTIYLFTPHEVGVIVPGEVDSPDDLDDMNITVKNRMFG
jgi:FtsZ-interacting cell division protein YlmF